MAKVITQHRRGTTAEWEQSSVVVADGELIIEICDDGSRKTKIGDGVHTFADLPYTTAQLESDIELLSTRLDNVIRSDEADGSITEDDHARLVSLASEVADIRVGYDKTVYQTAGDAVRDLGEQFAKFKNAEAIDGLHYEDNMLYLTANGGQVLENTGVEIIGGSGGGEGGGGSSNGTVVTLKNMVTDADGNKTTIINTIADAKLQLKFIFESTIDGESTGNGTCTLTVNGITKVTNYKINNGSQSTLEITDYIAPGENTVKLECTDAYGTSRKLIYTVNVLELDLSSTFNSYIPYTEDIDFRYRITSLLDTAEIYFYVTPEGEERRKLAQKTFTSSMSGKEQQQIIPIASLPHGITTLEVYAEATQDGNTLPSNVLKYDLIITLENETAAMIASVLDVKEVNQGDTVSIPYVVYDPVHTETTVLLQTSVLEGDDYVVKTTDKVTVGRDMRLWNTKNYPEGTVKFSILYYDAYDEDGKPTGSLKAEKHHIVLVNESLVDVEAEENPVLYLTSTDKSNDADNRAEWKFGNISTTFTGFNWKSNGWVQDSATTNNTVLRINGGARATINYFPFANLDTALLNHGMTFEFEYAIRDLNDRNTSVIRCCDENVITVTNTVKNETTGEDITVTREETRIVGIKALPDRVIFGSTQTNVTCHYKSNERLRVSFVIEQNNDDSSRFISAYVDGTLTQVQNYAHGSDSFNNNYNIELGSDGCTLDVYSIRIYDRALTAREILNNTIADETNVGKQIEVFTDNDIYDSYGRLSYEEVKTRIPTVTFIGAMPTYKGDKRVVKMDFVNPFDHSRDFSNVYGGPIDVEIDVQGTSSQYYVRKNWKVKLKKKDKTTGENIFNHDAYQHMKDEVPAKVFCLKVDYAEGTGTHNTQNANFAETLYEGKVPAQYDDERVRTTVTGFPIAIFERATATSDPIFSSKGNFNFDKDAEEAFGFTDDYDVECWEFCNNVHDTTKFLTTIDPIDWSENFEPRCYYPKYANKVDFDRVEDLQEKKDAENSTITAAETAELNQLRQTAIARFKRMHDWVASTKNNVDKFRSEFTKYFNLEYALVYYIYTFVGLMTDQRAKNMFLTYWGKRVLVNENTRTWWIEDVDSKILANEAPPTPTVGADGVEYFNVDGKQVQAGSWYPYLYDNDTCFGIDNSGNLVFDYYHEDVDTFEGATWNSDTKTWTGGQKLVYNGQQSILWDNFRQAFSNEIKEKYATLRSAKKLTYDALYNQFITEGSEHYSASIYNEDAEFKYLCMARPKGNGTNEDGSWKAPDVSNLYQVKGDGKHHLKYFLENRFKYCDSKWHAGDYSTDIIYLRINGTTAGAENDTVVEGGAAEGTHEGYSSTIKVTPFSSMYCGVQYGAGSSVQKHRCNVDEEAEFSYTGGTPNDLETTIFGASELASIGDISNLFVSRLEFRTPNKLRELKIGSSAAGYQNTALKALSLNNLPLLQKLDITNCSALTGDIDCSACTNIQEVNALGANSLSGVKLSNGGYVKKLYLPASISSLNLKSQHDLKFDGTFTYAQGYGFGIGSATAIDCTNIQDLVIYDCPNVDASLIFNTCIQNEAGKLRAVRINNLTLEADDWTDIRKFYLPKESDVGLEDTVGTSYFVKDGVYYKKVLNSTPINTGIPASAGYGYGLSGINSNDIKVDEIYLSGVCTLNQDMSGADMAELVKYLPYLEFRTGEKEGGGNYSITSVVTFMNNAGTEVLEEVTVSSTSTVDVTCPDPIASGKITAEELTIDSTIKYSYAHSGWSINPTTDVIDGIPSRKPQPGALTNIVGNRTLYPTYTANIRYYPLEFYNEEGTTLLYREESVKYFESDSDYVIYPNLDPEKENVDDPTIYPFSGWNPAPCITPENLALNNNELVKVYAVFKTIDEQWEIPNINEINYSLSGSNMSITGRTDSWADDPNVFVRIPNTFLVGGTNYTTTSLTGFHDFDTLRWMNIPDSLTALPPTSVTGGQRGAFENCPILEQVNISKGVKDLGAHTFANCPKLTNILYDAKKADGSNWDDLVFTGAGNGKLRLTISENVEELPTYGIASTSSSRAKIDKLIWSNNNKCYSIGNSCFTYTDINKSQVITGYDENDDPIYSNENVFTLPEGLRTISDYAFAGSSCPLSKIHFPSTLTSISPNAFEKWTNLTEFNIPHGTLLEPGAFTGCSNIINIDTSESTRYDFQSGCLTIPEDDTLVLATKSYEGIPSGITILANNSFDALSSLTSIDLNGVTTVGQQTFRDCPNLTSVTMTNNTVQSLGNQAFYNCINLSTVTLSTNISEIPAYAFYGTKLSTLNIPYSVKKISEAAFRLNTNLTSVSFDAGSNCTELGAQAFSKCSSLTGITLPSGITKIDDRAFEECTNLQTITLPNQLKRIYGGTFNKCSSLRKITIPDNVTQISTTNSYGTVFDGAFNNCLVLTEVTLGSGLTASSIADNTFSGCVNLLTIKTKLSQSAFGEVPANKWGATNATISYNA